MRRAVKRNRKEGCQRPLPPPPLQLQPQQQRPMKTRMRRPSGRWCLLHRPSHRFNRRNSADVRLQVCSLRRSRLLLLLRCVLLLQRQLEHHHQRQHQHHHQLDHHQHPPNPNPNPSSHTHTHYPPPRLLQHHVPPGASCWPLNCLNRCGGICYGNGRCPK